MKIKKSVINQDTGVIGTILGLGIVALTFFWVSMFLIMLGAILLSPLIFGLYIIWLAFS